MTDDMHLNDEDIALFADALKLKKTRDLPASLVEHVADCRTCKAQILQIYRIIENQDERPLGPHPFFHGTKEPTHRGMSILYRIAAMLALAVGGGGLLYYLSTRSGQETAQTASQRPIVSPQTDSSRGAVSPDDSHPVLAENLVPNADLENLVGMRTRSEGIRVFSPLNGGLCDAATLFRWQSAGKTVQFRVVNNKGVEVFRKETSASRLRLGKIPQPGLYYWMLRTNGELAYVGKFFVK